MALGDRASPEPARRYSSSSTRRRRLPSPQTTPPARVLGQRVARTLPFPCIKRFPHKPRPRGRVAAPRGPGCRLHRRRATRRRLAATPRGRCGPLPFSWRGDGAAGGLFGAATGKFSCLPRRLFPELMTNKNGHLCVDASGPSPCAAGVRVVDMRLIPWDERGTRKCLVIERRRRRKNEASDQRSALPTAVVARGDCQRRRLQPESARAGKTPARSLRGEL